MFWCMWIANLSVNLLTASAPDQAINLICNVATSVRMNEYPSVKQALAALGKDRKTLLSSKHIYYLSKINPDLLKEVSVSLHT